LYFFTCVVVYTPFFHVIWIALEFSHNFESQDPITLFPTII
jgi:hypothetical protein